MGEFQAEIHKQADDIVDLKQKLLKTKQIRHFAQEKYDHEIAGIQKQMDEAGDRLVAERDALLDRLNRVYDAASQYKKLLTKS